MVKKEVISDLIFERINQMLEEVKFPDDEDADVCTNLIMKDIDKYLKEE